MISRRILAAVALLCSFAAPAYAQKTKAAIIAEIPVLCPSGQLTGSCTITNAQQLWSDLANSIMPTAPVVSGNLACFNGTTGLLQDCGSSPTGLGIGVGSTVVSSGTSGRVLYDNAGVLGEYATVPVANGGTNSATASGTALDNITGFSSTGFLTRTGSGTYAFQSTTNGVTNGNLAQPLAATLKGNPTSGTANALDFTLQGLTNTTPNSTLDYFVFYNHSTGTLQSATASQISSAVGSGVTSLGGLTGAVTLGTGLGTSGSSITQNLANFDNLLPNNQWQQWTGDVITVKQNSTGTAPQTPASCASFTTSNGAPTFTCSNTQQIKVGDIVVIAGSASFTTAAITNFWGFAGAGYISCNAGTVQCTGTAGTTTSCTVNTFTCYLMGSRVIGVVANTSITIQGYVGGVSLASSLATVLYPESRGNNGDGLTISADGWSKTGSLIVFPDDFSAHVYPGAIRTLLTRGGITGTESVTYNVPTNQLGRYQGQVLSCGVAAYQTVQGGTGTWNVTITDNTGTTTSSNGSGTSAGGYQFESVTRTIASSATSVSISLNKTGNSGDVLYWALPTCGFVPSIVQSQLHQNSNEYIVADGHCNPPILTPLVVQFSTSLGGGLYGYTGIDLEAISLGCWHNSLGGVMSKIEWTTSTVGAMILTSTDAPFSSFGLQAYTQVSGVTNATVGLQRLTSNGYFAMVTATSGLTPTSGTWDWWDGVAGAPNPLH
jgi:hypothetical protein